MSRVTSRSSAVSSESAIVVLTADPATAPRAVEPARDGVDPQRLPRALYAPAGRCGDERCSADHGEEALDQIDDLPEQIEQGGEVEALQAVHRSVPPVAMVVPGAA